MHPPPCQAHLQSSRLGEFVELEEGRGGWHAAMWACRGARQAGGQAAARAHLFPVAA